MNRILLIKFTAFIVACLIANNIAFGTEISKRKKQAKRIEKDIREEIVVDTKNLRSLDNYLKAGLKNNPGLKALFYKWKSELNNISRSYSLPEPKLTYSKFIESIETRVGPQESSIEVIQMIPLPDKLWLKKKKAFKNSEIAYYDFENKRLDLVNKITSAYYEYAYLSKEILITEENMKLLSNFESVAESKYSAGLTKNQDLLKVQVELGKLESDLLSLNDLRTSIVANINALLNVTQNTDLPWPNESLEKLDLNEDYKKIGSLYDALKVKNPQLMSASKLVEKNKSELALAKRGFFPDLTLGVKKIETGEALNPAMADSGKDPLVFMATINFPLWIGKNASDISSAKASVLSAEYAYKNTENELLAQLAMVHFRLRDSVRQSNLYENALIPKAVQTLNATKSGYEAGKLDFISLIDAQRMLLSFQLAFYRHNASYYQYLSATKKLLGEFE